MTIPRNRLLSTLLWAAGVLIIGYQLVYFTGLYRWASDMQSRLLGFYLPYVSLVPTLIFVVPAAMMSPPPRERPEFSESEIELADRFDNYADLAIYKLRCQLRWLCFVIPTLAILTALTAGLATAARNERPAAPIIVDVAKFQSVAPPLGQPVTLIGIPDAEHVAVISVRSTHEYTDRSIVPVVARDNSGSVRFFVILGRTTNDSMLAMNKFQRTGSIDGALSENTLGGEYEATFERMGVKIARPCYVLGDLPPTNGDRYRVLAIFFGIALAVFAFMLLRCLLLIRKYRLQRD